MHLEHIHGRGIADLNIPPSVENIYRGVEGWRFVNVDSLASCAEGTENIYAEPSAYAAGLA